MHRGIKLLEISVITATICLAALDPDRFSATALSSLPTAPTSLSVTALDGNACNVSWSGDPKSTFYEVHLRTSDGLIKKVTIMSKQWTVIRNLKPGATYDVRVRGVSGFGTSAYSSVVVCKTPDFKASSSLPTAPTSVIATTLDGNACNVSWSGKPKSATFYKVFIKTADGSMKTVTIMSKQWFVIRNLKPDTTYGIRVQAVSGFGNSALSEKVVCKAPGSTSPPPRKLNAPTALTVKRIRGDVYNVSWDREPDIGYRLLSYRLHYSAWIGERLHGTRLSIGKRWTRIRNLVAGVEYKFRVKALITSDRGNGPWIYSPWSPIVVFRKPGSPPPTPIKTPTALTVKRIRGNSYNVSWDSELGDQNTAVGYRLEYKVKIGERTDATSLLLKKRWTVIGNVVAGVEYKFKVKAVTAFGTSAWSPTLIFRKPGSPPPSTRRVKTPTALTVKRIRGNLYNVSWDSELGDQNSRVGYRLEYNAKTGERTNVMSLSVKKQWTLIRSLASGVEYNFRVKAVTAFGTSAWSPTLIFRKNEPLFISTVLKDPKPKVGETVVFRCRASGYPKPVIRWYVNNRIPSGRRYTIKVNGRVSLLQVLKVKKEDHGSLISCVATNVRGITKSQTSLTVDGVKVVPIVIPFRPRNLHAIFVSPFVVDLKWTPPQDANENTTYQLQYKNGTNKWDVYISRISDPTYRLVLASKKTYTIHVRQSKRIGVSPWTAPLLLTTSSANDLKIRNLRIFGDTPNSVTVAWWPPYMCKKISTAAMKYELRYRPVGSTKWTVQTVYSNAMGLQAAPSKNNIEISVRPRTDGNFGIWSKPVIWYRSWDC